LARDKKFTPEEMAIKLSKVLDATNRPLFGREPDKKEKVEILPDKTVTPGKFLPHHLLPGAFKAHPQTIAAVRKDIFLGGEGFEDLEEMIECSGCHESIDKQFWVFCPMCGAAFSE
jgi:hypothetical protein